MTRDVTVLRLLRDYDETCGVGFKNKRVKEGQHRMQVLASNDVN